MVANDHKVASLSEVQGGGGLKGSTFQNLQKQGAEGKPGGPPAEWSWELGFTQMGIYPSGRILQCAGDRVGNCSSEAQKGWDV